MMDRLQALIAHHWGFATLRPLQAEAMQAVLDRRDSVVVLPTGGGKSLCFQAPALVMPGITVVVSPLIALMKDQVDGLRASGINAVQIDSSLSSQQRSQAISEIKSGQAKLVYMSPERLMMPEFQSLLHDAEARAFAIDEAHCISHWGHDFRQEYRQLSRIRERFPRASVHAYTATATEQVRSDLMTELQLRDPKILVGSFDRPNLIYRVIRRENRAEQILDVLSRHEGEPGIIYCLRRVDVDEVAQLVTSHGRQALPYHAGMDAEQRHAVQDAFAAEECHLIVATIAFGMGIDRSNIRFVLHTTLPKSIEHYQQETGRAGRDGLEAECVLLYSGADVMSWQAIIKKSAEENGAGPHFLPSAMRHLNDMDRYCRAAVCRHRALVEYFDQALTTENCGACDVCLGDLETVPDAQVLAQKILSCVARVRERFGIGHVASVLHGDCTERIEQLGHNQLSTHGLLRDHGKAELRDWIFQLIGQKVLIQTSDEYPILKLNAASWEVMHGKRTVALARSKQRVKAETKSASVPQSWEGVDRKLFEHLRKWRAQTAKRIAKPAYIIFGDETLRDLARRRPRTEAALRQVWGIGEKKAKDYGEELLALIQAWGK